MPFPKPIGAGVYRPARFAVLCDKDVVLNFLRLNDPVAGTTPLDLNKHDVHVTARKLDPKQIAETNYGCKFDCPDSSSPGYKSAVRTCACNGDGPSLNKGGKYQAYASRESELGAISLTTNPAIVSIVTSRNLGRLVTSSTSLTRALHRFLEGKKERELCNMESEKACVWP